VVLTAVTMKNVVFRSMMLCSLVEFEPLSSKTSANFYHTAWLHVSEDSILHMLKMSEKRVLKEILSHVLVATVNIWIGE
jgi:hypothetical protein